MSASNYDSVIDQLHAAGLQVEYLDLGRFVRCRVEGQGREKRGWYRLHEFFTKEGEALIVGSFGVWHGADQGAQKIQLSKREWTPDQRAALKARLAEDRRQADQERKTRAQSAARRAAAGWDKCEPVGESDYLARKGVSGHGVRYSPSGALVIPMCDTGGRIHGLQVIRSGDQAKRRLAKEYWPQGALKAGHFHMIGGPHGSPVILAAEGYATAATLYEATGYPVAVTFDAGNLLPVAQALHRRYKTAAILLCADDDVLQKCQACGERVSLVDHPTDCTECGAPHRARNAGVESASAAAVAVGGAWCKPEFADETARVALFQTRGSKLTDFNDLHAAEGLHVVRAQIEATLGALGWFGKSAARGTTTTTGDGAAKALKPIETTRECTDRYSYVYGNGGGVFDHQEHALVTLSEMRDLCLSRAIHRAWMESPDRRIVRARNVGFDPSGEDPDITCNLWAGWPTEPKQGDCSLLLELLWHMCADEEPAHAQKLYDWMLCWLALPLQRPGAKLKTTVVIHGPQGAGKNMFFETYMAIYGRYGRVINQDAIEDRFNDWCSAKLFLIADEVVARSDVYHVKNKLKALITGDWVRINPKNVAAYDERNHCNMVFLSNEGMPVVLEEDDRRHTVIWTPGELSMDFYAGVKREIENGGIAALHYYLLHHRLGDFGEATRPPETSARRILIDLSQDSTTRFWDEWRDGEIPIRYIPALSTEIYELYQLWCKRQGYGRAAPLHKLSNALERKRGVRKDRRRYELGNVMDAERLKQGTFLLPGDVECPPAKHEYEWLGECVAAFRTGFDDWKGTSHA